MIVEECYLKQHIIIYYNGGYLGTLFKVKVRKVGTSFGVLIPKEIVEEQKIKENEIVEVAVLKRNLSLLKNIAGTIKAGSWKREKEHRDKEF